MASVNVSTANLVTRIPIEKAVNDTRERKADGKAVAEHDLRVVDTEHEMITERMGGRIPGGVVSETIRGNLLASEFPI
jgi:hypothetical protein